MGATTEATTAAGTVGSYTAAAKWFHWVTAALIAVALPLGFVIQHVKDSDKMPFYAVHESAGLTILLVAVLRLLWRWRHPPPPYPAHIPRSMRAAANGVHHALYALLIVQPILGFFMTNAYGFPLRGQTAYLGFIEFPKFMEPVTWLADALKAAHAVVGVSIAVLLVIHIGAVVFHQAIRRDGTLLRMV